MANKRSLRKYIECVCGEIAAECIIASNVIEGIDRKAMEQQVVKVALMQESALRRVGVTFDRRPCDFENGRAYRRARNAYYRAAYRSLLDTLHSDVEATVAEMNKALPARKN